ncbi:cytochrome P450, partial [Streptomyces corynorhini]
MTSAVSPADQRGAELPEFPMARAAKCPFDPPPGLRDKQREGPLGRVRLWDGSTPWVVTRHADQRTLLGDPRVSADLHRPGYPSPVPIAPGSGAVSFILMDDPEHGRLRRMVTAPFAFKRIEAMRPAVQKITDDLLDAMLAGPRPVDLVQTFALPLPSLVICELLGVPYGDHDFFQDNSKVLINREVEPEERLAASKRLAAYLGDLVGEKAAHPADDLLSGLVGRVETGELTRDDVAQMGVLLLIAGHET